MFKVAHSGRKLFGIRIIFRETKMYLKTLLLTHENGYFRMKKKKNRKEDRMDFLNLFKYLN